VKNGDNDSESKANFLKKRAEEIWPFIKVFVMEQSVPQRRDNVTGGVALLGWSLGSMQRLSSVAFVKGMENLKKQLEPRSRLTSYMIGHDDCLKRRLNFFFLLASSRSRLIIHGFSASKAFTVVSSVLQSSLLPSDQIAAFITSITSYFHHLNISAPATI